MDDTSARRQLVSEVRSQLDGWTDRARVEAYAELFEGDDPILSEEELRLLHAVDSRLELHGGDGVWGTDQYGIHAADGGRSTDALSVVCVYHPQVTSDSVLRGLDDLDDETEERINAALWTYAERVTEHIEDALDEYLDRD
ncbi:DUF7539 family protein [Halobaculum magnesiiphilum]|uniref:Uncharacterized protein n=1 Tax=Halobaculum magnesiiphilum TaxID=1017351 RepID=A0A8T8WA35_9EURY|nr:hypothetical protein [Halobaculum magnesiiphilum]QZP36688.1 hypothetical protein K6T50_10250 [Halobaculum magnesiiphilum]